MRLPLLTVLLALIAVPAYADAIVDIPGGTFLMGTRADSIEELKSRYEVGYRGVFENEIPEHEVILRGFRLDANEVTNQRFATFVKANPQWQPGELSADLHNGDYLKHWTDGDYPAGQGDLPVVFVTWHPAQAFCRWAGGRLPTEAEWEYAARAGDDREFPWGDALPSIERTNYYLSDYKTPVAVGSYAPNGFGLHDMAGNVWEFLLDAWSDTYGSESATNPAAGGWVDDENLLAVTGRRVVRGASFGGAVVNLRTRWRDSHVVTNAIAFVGFRCAYPGADM